MKTILIVDDDNALADVLGIMFGIIGDVAVQRACNGQEGVEKAGQLIPDLIVMDYKMPGMNGWEAARLIKINPTTNKIPIIGYTAWASKEDIQKGISYGINEIITKPVDLDVWESKFNTYLR